MNKKSPLFLALTGAALAAVLMVPAYTAFGYAIGGTGTATSSGTYNFGQSFDNLVSPFVDFVKNIQLNGKTISVGVGIGSGAGIGAPIAISVNVGSYESQFNDWFYKTTGVRIDGVTGAIVGSFNWLFGALDGVVKWIAGAFTQSLPKAPQ